MANSCYKNEYLSNHPEMTSVVDQLTPSHPSLCNIVSCPDLYEEKGLVTIERFLVRLCQVCTLNSEQANKIAVHQIKIASFAQPKKHSVVTSSFSTLKYNTHLFRCKECREISDQRTHLHLQLYVGVSKQLFCVITICHPFFSLTGEMFSTCARSLAAMSRDLAHVLNISPV